jgi:hypothetical protein
MKEVTIENGGTPVSDLNDPQCTHIVINDQEVKQLTAAASVAANEDVNVTGGGTGAAAANLSTASGPMTPTSSKLGTSSIYIDMNAMPFSNTRASIVKAEWFWASIQICCRASECLYEFTKVS